MLATRRAEAITLRLTNRMTGSRPVQRRVEDRANLSFFQLRAGASVSVRASRARTSHSR